MAKFDEPAAEEDFIAEIYAALYGKPIDRNEKPLDNRLLAELKAFAKTYRPGVSQPAIRNWFLPNPKRPNGDKKSFILQFVQNRMNDPELQAFIVQQLRGIETRLKRLTPSEPGNPTPAALDPIVIERISILFDASARNPRQVTNDLFRGASPEAYRDFSYFLIYRYSTKGGDVLKSFLVVQKPEPGFLTHFGFNHFIWGGPGRNHHVFRECEGVILKLEKSYYFLGYNFLVSANKRAAPEKYQSLRAAAKSQPNGMGLIAAEFADILANPGLFGGVTITLARDHQPVVSRVVFLHVGTKSELELEISDSDVSPGELQPAQLEDDLKRTIDRLQKKNCKKFGMEIQSRIDDNTWRQGGARKLAKAIGTMLSNVPTWKPKKGRRKPGVGALETFGPVTEELKPRPPRD